MIPVDLNASAKISTSNDCDAAPFLSQPMAVVIIEPFV